MSAKLTPPTPPMVAYFSVKELKKMINYAEQHEVDTVQVTMSGSSGIGITTTVAKRDGSDVFDVTDVDCW